MAVDLQQIYDDKVRQYATSGGGDDRFTADFLMAVKYAVSELNMRLQLSTTIPTDIDDEIDVSETYAVVFDAVTDFYLMKQGQKFDMSGGFSLKDADDRKEEMLANYNMNIILSESDDDEDDVIGLGHKG